MAKTSKSVSFSNCLIDLEAGTITEFSRDDESTFSIADVLSDFDGIMGVSISIKQCDDLLPATNNGEED